MSDHRRPLRPATRRLALRGDRHATTAGGASTHDVTVSSADATGLAAATDQADVERLVYETFEFLLEREPKAVDPAPFDLPVRRPATSPSTSTRSASRRLP